MPKPLPYTPDNLNNTQGHPIYQMRGDEIIASFGSLYEANKVTGISNANIAKVLKGKGIVQVAINGNILKFEHGKSSKT